MRFGAPQVVADVVCRHGNCKALLMRGATAVGALHSAVTTVLGALQQSLEPVFPLCTHTAGSSLMTSAKAVAPVLTDSVSKSLGRSLLGNPMTSPA